MGYNGVEYYGILEHLSLSQMKIEVHFPNSALHVRAHMASLFTNINSRLKDSGHRVRQGGIQDLRHTRRSLENQANDYGNLEAFQNICFNDGLVKGEYFSCMKRTVVCKLLDWWMMDSFFRWTYNWKWNRSTCGWRRWLSLTFLRFSEEIQRKAKNTKL